MEAESRMMIMREWGQGWGRGRCWSKGIDIHLGEVYFLMSIPHHGNYSLV